MVSENVPVALPEWAVTCDALARGEQILLLRSEILEAGGGERGSPGGGPAGLEHERFWLLPRWGGPSLRDVTDPYRDRLRALDRLTRADGKARLQYLARTEYSERIGDPDRLRRLDGHHTLTAAAVERRLLEARSPGLLFMVLRVFRRDTALVVEEPSEAADRRGWIPLGGRPELPAEPDSGRTEPVVPDGRFMERKAELLQLSRSVTAT